VLPPFWETWWFQVGIVAVGLTLAASFYRLRVKRIEHERQQLEQLVAQRTTELWSTNQHLQLLNSRLQDELAIAREIQQSLLPPPQPQWANLSVVCYSSSAHEVGGDFYAYHAFDYFPVSTLEAKHDRFAIAVGDVSGKGMPAALLMAISLASFHSLIPHVDSPRALLTKLDEAIRPYTRTRQQNCALCCVEIVLINEQIKQLKAMNAGCLPPIIWRTNGQLEWLDVGGFPLGTALSVPSQYQEVTTQLVSGDLIILSSDGVVEAMTEDKAIFGFERLEEIIRHGPVDSAEAMLLHLKKEVAHFVGQAEPHDDLTIVVIKV
jgi:serine phosphatase RsbU (regulator of sigma subunit)